MRVGIEGIQAIPCRKKLQAKSRQASRDKQSACIPQSSAISSSLGPKAKEVKMIVSLRPITPSDCDLICRHREAMFRESGHAEDILAAMADPYRTWQQACLADGSYFGFVAEKGDIAIAGVGLMAIDWPPNPRHPQVAKRGYVLNLFVEPEARRRGIARQLMAAAERTFEERGLTYSILHSTKQGRPLYEAEGWAQTSELAKKLPAPTD